MTILVAFASKHGATREIAERIAEKLQGAGYTAECLPVNTEPDAAAYEAVVLGSALYYGAWMKEATEYLLRHRAALAALPVWLFSSGPLGVEAATPDEQPRELSGFRDAIHPRGHQLFYGALDHGGLTFPERMVIKAVRAPEGDYRDWPAIEAWAEHIASDLTPRVKEASPQPAPGL